MTLPNRMIPDNAKPLPPPGFDVQEQPAKYWCLCATGEIPQLDKGCT